MIYAQHVLFVDEAYFKKITYINEAVDPNLIWPAMYVAQDKWIAPYLGTDLYAKLKTDIPSPAGDYLVLMRDYVVDAVCWWTLVELLPSLSYKLDNGSLVQRSSEDTTPVSDEVMKDMIYRAKSNALYYTQRMVNYLGDNSSLFAEYTAGTSCPRTDVYGNSSYIISRGNSATGYPRYIHNIFLP